MTLSIGVTESQPADSTVMAVVARADKALYRAKREGRNRIVSWVAPAEADEPTPGADLEPAGPDRDSGPP